MRTIKRLAFPLSLGLLLTLPTGCPCPTTDARCNGGVGGGSGGGSGGSGGSNTDVYARFTLDPTTSDRYYMEIVTDPTRNRVGVAYVAGVGELPIIYSEGDAGITGPVTTDGGNYDIKYVEWEDGVVKPPQRVDTVRRMVGISVDFHPTSGEPAIGYLGGGSDMSTYWYNSDAMLATRTGGTTWSKDTAAQTGVQATCGNPVSDTAAGVVVGLWSAIRYDSAGTLTYCYRDVHTAQYPQGDWAGSDVECVRGRPANWTRECTYPGGNTKNAPGGRIRMLMINDVPYIFWDQVFGGGDTSGQNVWMQSRPAVIPHGGMPPTQWGSLQGVFTAAGTQHGVSVDYDTMEGIGAALLDTTDNVLRYTNRALTATAFNNADQVFGDGTGGWYPSLAMDKINHEPAIAYYVCSQRSNQNASQCQPDFDEVRVTQRINNEWASHTETVDTVSVTTLKLGFLPDGRKVIAYREKDGTLKLAVRKVP